MIKRLLLWKEGTYFSSSLLHCCCKLRLFLVRYFNKLIVCQRTAGQLKKQSKTKKNAKVFLDLVDRNVCEGPVSTRKGERRAKLQEE